MKKLATALASFAAALLWTTPAQAELILAINEGVTYYVTPTEIREKYKDLSDLLRSEEHTSELQSPDHLVCRLLLEKKKQSSQTRRSSSLRHVLCICDSPAQLFAIVRA